MKSKETELDVKNLLASLASGDESAADSLFPIVYDELHRLATAVMKHERANHTLQPTALIHEAYLRLVRSDTSNSDFHNIDHFMATASIIMRRILINHAKAKKAKKRLNPNERSPLDELGIAFEERSMNLIALDEALERLADLDPRQARLVELRFFGGMTVEQCANVLHISTRNVYYEWALAKAWLRSQLADA